MCRRTRFVVLCALIAGIALAGDQLQAAQPEQNLSADAYRQNERDIAARMERLEAELKQMSSALAQQSDAAGQSVVKQREDTNDRLTQIEQTLEGMRAVIRQMREMQDELSNQVKSQERREVKKSSSTFADNSSNSPSPTPVPMQGRLVLQNWTGQSHRVVVNGQTYWVSPGRTVLSVPHAIVEAYMPAHEGPQLFGMSNWKWNGQGYEMFITLRTT